MKDPECRIDLSHLGDNLSWDDGEAAYLINPERELEIAKRTAVTCGICDEKGGDDFAEWFTLGGEGFTRQQ